AFGLPHLCGEAGVTCAPGMPTFRILQIQGSPPPNPPPPSNGTGQESHNLWALEVSLDVEWAHAIAPEADILLVTTPTAEILGVQGFPQMMNAENFRRGRGDQQRSEEHTSELQSHLKHVCRLLLEKKNSNWRQLGSRITLP